MTDRSGRCARDMVAESPGACACIAVNICTGSGVTGSENEHKRRRTEAPRTETPPPKKGAKNRSPLDQTCPGLKPSPPLRAKITSPTP